MTDTHPHTGLGARERQILDILYRLRSATANEVQRELGEPLSNSAVRGMLRLLVSKGRVRQEQEGARYIYFPAQPEEEASRSMLEHVVETFFRNSPTSAMATLIEASAEPITDAEYERLRALLEQARERSGGER
jgi:BlaI family transcriptional regulator, penicillinase repressor